MRPGSLNLDLSAKEPSENQNSPAETGRQAGALISVWAQPMWRGRGLPVTGADRRIWKRDGRLGVVCVG